MPSHLFSLRLMFDLSKFESLHDVSVTRIGDTLSYGFLQTEVVLVICNRHEIVTWERLTCIQNNSYQATGGACDVIKT